MQLRNLILLGWIIFVTNPAIGKHKSIIPDTSVNGIKLNDPASTEKVLGPKVWEKHFEAGGLLPRIEIVNHDRTQVLRLLFHYGGSKNSVDEFEILAIDKSYKLPTQVIVMDVDRFLESRSIALLIKKESVIKAIGNKYKVLKGMADYEQLYFEIDNSSDFVKRHNEYKYYIKCSFKNGSLIKYSFGFQSV